MRRIRLTFPNGTAVRADLLEEAEPELCEDLWRYLTEERLLICHNTLSTGYSFAAYRRPSTSPNTSAHLANPIGRGKVGYTELRRGDLLWTKTKLYVAYGPCTEPGLVGAVTARVAEGDLEPFEAACRDVWQYTYSLHRLALLRAAREAE